MTLSHRAERFDYRWWPIEDVLASTHRSYPARLPVLPDRFLGGERTDEPFELWSLGRVLGRGQSG